METAGIQMAKPRLIRTCGADLIAIKILNTARNAKKGGKIPASKIRNHMKTRKIELECENHSGVSKPFSYDLRCKVSEIISYTQEGNKKRQTFFVGKEKDLIVEWSDHLAQIKRYL